MTTNFLNLDDVQPTVKKTIQLKGKTHEYVVPSVADFLKQTRRARELDKEFGENAPLDILVDQLVDFCQTCFPTAPREDLESLNMRQLQAIQEHATTDFEVTDEVKKQEGNA